MYIQLLNSLVTITSIGISFLFVLNVQWILFHNKSLPAAMRGVVGIGQSTVCDLVKLIKGKKEFSNCKF